MNVNAQITDIDEILNREILKSKTPSIQYLLFNKDSILYEKRIGFADVKNSKPISSKTTYNFYSVTKTFTALAITQLVEDGKIELDKTASSYLPNFPYVTNITVRQLLNHSAGIPNPMPLHWIHLEGEHKEFNRNAFFRRIFEKHNKVKYQPNEKFSYSNLGYVLLGQIIETTSEMSYEKYIEEKFLKKIKIENDVGFIINENQAIGYQKRKTIMNFILGFLIDKSKFMGKSIGKWKSFKRSYVNGNSYGGLIGTANGLVKYLQEFLNPKSNFVTIRQKIMLFSENYTNNNKSTGMCLSWFKGETDKKEYFTHAGGGGGYYCEVRIYPELGIGSLILMNRSGMKDERFLDNLDRYYFKQNEASR
jgi:CubicO group peptidase (beta-lactamase class C family)